MNIITEQNGGADRYLDDSDVVLEKRRSYILGEINQKNYEILKSNKKELRYGETGVHRSGGIALEVFQPGEELVFEHELLTMEDYEYPDKTVGYSTFYTTNIIEEYPSTTGYRVLAIDLIWCRENTLLERLQNLVKY